MRKLRNLGAARPAWIGVCWALLLLCPPLLRAQTQTVQFAIPTFSVYENQTNVTIVAVRSGGVSGEISVDFATMDGGAVSPQDFTATNGTLTFLDGEVVKLFQVFITQDLLNEGDEAFNVVLSNPNGVDLGFQSTAQVLIFDDDTMFTFSSATYLVREDGTNAVITVQRNPASASQASVGFQTGLWVSTNAPPATAGLDYTSVTTNLLFTNGQSLATVLIPIENDCLVETNGECILLTLTNAVGAVIGPRDTAVLTITDDDTAAGTIEFAVDGPFSRLESANPRTVDIPVARRCGTVGAVSIQYRIFRDDVGFPTFPFPTLCNGGVFARTNLDFTGGYGTLNWADMDGTNKTITITILDENWVELNEELVVELYNPLPRPIGPTLGTRRQFSVFIINDDLAAGMADPSYNRLVPTNPTPGANNTVYAIAAYPPGSTLAGRSIIAGDFTSVNAVVRNGVADGMFKFFIIYLTH